MKTLLTFAGPQDPFTPGSVAGEEHPGPVLALLRARSFDQVILLSYPDRERETRETRRAIEEAYPDTKLRVQTLNLNDPARFSEVVTELRRAAARLREEDAGREYFVSVVSGTPQIHAAWLWLAAVGELDAKILEARPHYYVSMEKPRITRLRAGEAPAGYVTYAETDPESAEEPGAVFLDDLAAETGCLGGHPSFRRALETAAALALHEAPVLLLGETGTGKDLFARFIHRLSSRRNGPFQVVNAAALPEALAESLLFGHEKGAFTGAVRKQSGKFQQADGGSLFLDEIGELPPAVQAKLLRVVEDGLVEPLGTARPVPVSVRVITASNRDIESEAARGTFRRDLYYRLRVGEVRLPALRERASDIPLLAMHFLDRVNVSLKNPKHISRKAIRFLETCPWPGNVRDLRNAIERAAILSPRDVLEPEDFAPGAPAGEAELPPMHENFSLEAYISGQRRRLVEKALAQTRGNQSAAARLLGVTPQAVHKFVKSRSAP